jgi:thiopurine S-methyltransferase
MTTLDAAYWQERYLNNQTGWDLEAISRPLKEYIDSLTNKTLAILIPGAGYGHEALYLFKKGFKHVTILDLASEPLEHIANKLPEDHPYRLVHEDFFTHQGFYDLILEQTFYCALELRFRESYFKHMHHLLHSDGMLAGLLFHFDQERPGPPFTCSPAAYRVMASRYFTIKSLTPCLNSEPSRAGKELFLQLKKNT